MTAVVFAVVGALALPISTSAAMSRGFARMLDAVVRIEVREVAYEDGERQFSAGVGSGVIVGEEGSVLTNAHVASPRAVELSVTLASLEEVRAKLVGWDRWTDLALLRIDMDEVRRHGTG
jgi:serine protease Do